ncbi:MAG: glutathione S-transferase family protein [Polyangiaceae bacterium]
MRLLLTQLGIPFERIDVDILTGKTRTADFLAKNANGRIPLLEVSPEERLAESNAIILYLAEGTPFLPQDRWQRAKVYEWLFFEQYSHEPNIATPRFWIKFLPPDESKKPLLEQKKKLGYAALDVMEKHLASRRFFVGETYSIADIALYAYTHVAEDGEFDLAPYSAIRAWFDRVRAEPRHIPITQA